jgi:hypothetical protein
MCKIMCLHPGALRIWADARWGDAVSGCAPSICAPPHYRMQELTLVNQSPLPLFGEGHTTRWICTLLPSPSYIAGVWPHSQPFDDAGRSWSAGQLVSDGVIQSNASSCLPLITALRTYNWLDLLRPGRKR